MDAPDPFSLISAGMRVQLELAPDRRVRLTVDFVRRNLSSIWCHIGPERELPELLAGPRVLTLEVGDASGLLKVPVMLGSAAVTERSDGRLLAVSFQVLPGTIWVQRRRYFRLRNPPTTLRLAGADGSLQLDARTVNLGGGGVAVAVQFSALRPGDAVDIQFRIASMAPLPARGTVLREEPGPGAASVLAIQFTEIRESHRDRLVSLIFREQTRRRLAE
jgi:hypothetical protein